MLQLTSGQRWHVHILYRIGTADTILRGRRRRSTDDKSYKVGTNLMMINLRQTKANTNKNKENVMKERIVETHYVTNTTVIVVLVAVILVVVILSVGVVVYVRRRTIREPSANSPVTMVSTTKPMTTGSRLADPLYSDMLPPAYEQVTQGTRTSLDSKVIGTAV